MTNAVQIFICEKKRKYDRPRDAMRAMEKAVRSGKMFEKFGYYRCRLCGKYHLTTKLHT